VKPLDRHIREDLNRRLTLIGTQLGTPGVISDMVTKAHRSPLREEVVERNAKVNEVTIAAHERLERELKKLGVDTKPRFEIEPPLGSSRTRLHSRNG
jgi:hypothetical protein